MDTDNPLGQRKTIYLLSLLFAISILPLCLVKIPPLVDYLNHMARAHIIHDIANNTFYQTFYQLNWQAVPYLAQEIVMQIFMYFAPLFLSGKLFLLLTFSMILSGILLIQYGLFKEINPWVFASFFFFYNESLHIGLLNYLFGMGMMLLSFAFWVNSKSWRPIYRLPTAVLLVLSVYFSHLFPFAIYAITLVTYEVVEHIQQNGFKANKKILLTASMITAQLIIPFILYVNYKSTLQISPWSSPEILKQLGTPDISNTNIWKIFKSIIGSFFMQWTVIETAIITMLTSTFIYALLAKRFVIRLSTFFVCAVFGFLYLFAPLQNVYLLRLNIPMFCLFFAGSKINFKNKPLFLKIFLISLFTLLSLSMAHIYNNWQEANALYEDYEDVTNELKPGKHLLSISYEHNNVLTLWHIDSLSVIHHNVFSPKIFSGRHIILKNTEKYLTLKKNFSSVNVKYSFQEILKNAQNSKVDGVFTPIKQNSLLNQIFNNFDYLLLSSDTPISNPMKHYLVPISHKGIFYLYQIKKVTKKVTDNALKTDPTPDWQPVQ